jgi:hypothetical protein
MVNTTQTSVVESIKGVEMASIGPGNSLEQHGNFPISGHDPASTAFGARPHRQSTPGSIGKRLWAFAAVLYNRTNGTSSIAKAPYFSAYGLHSTGA